MEKETRLIQKVKRLVRRAGLPRWIHRFGPKKYYFWQHMIALLVKQCCQLSYRRVSWLLSQLGMIVPTYSALAKMVKRLPYNLWQRLLAATCSNNVHIAALDSTFFAKTNPSYHYLRRIDRKGPTGIPVKASVVVDTRRKKIIAARIRIRPRGDVLDVPNLLKQCSPRILVADKGYDSEAVHEHCFHHNIISMIPPRKSTKGGFYRRKMLKKYKIRTYHRREMAESKFSSTKRQFGSTVKCHQARTVRAELLARFIASNIFSLLLKTFSTTPFEPALLKI